jgi:SAM-dependent methyltransferase
MGQSNMASHALLVGRLAPRRGETWLDIGTGAGGVAIRAARAGAIATGIDVSEAALELARAAAREEGVDVRFELGDAQALAYGDGAFDVVSSAFGINFAPDHEAAARELARVTRNRIGLTLMAPDSRIADVWTLLRRHVSHGDHPADWGSEDRLRELLGDAFELEFELREGVGGPPPSTPEEAWKFFTETFGPLQEVLAHVDDAGAAELKREFLAIRERWEGKPTMYVLALGRRR